MTPAHGALTSVVHVGPLPPASGRLAAFGGALVDAMACHADAASIDVIDVVGAADLVVDDRAMRSGCARRTTWRRGDTSALSAVIDDIDRHDAAVVEHDFGIYGGDHGDGNVLRLVEAVSVPTVVVLHRVLHRPDGLRRLHVERLAAASEAVVVTSTAAFDRLLSSHAIDPNVVHVIPCRRHSGSGVLAWRRPSGASPAPWCSAFGSRLLEVLESVVELRTHWSTPRSVAAG